VYVFLKSSSVIVLIVPSCLITLWVSSIILAPTKISLMDEGVLVDEKFIRWQSIEKLNFSMSYLGDLTFSSQTVKITLKNSSNKIRLVTRIYDSHRKLRDNFEKLAIEHGVKVTVSDRGA
jgi:hypothetical protein